MPKPRNYLITPKLFGKQHDAVWLTNQNLDEIAAAEFQHLFSIEVRKAIRSRFGSLKEYCEQTQQNYQRLGQVLRGDVIISGPDIGSLRAHLGIETDFRSTDPSKLAGKLKIRDAMGAFYTPNDIALYLAKKVYKPNMKVLEPSFGEGSFIQALKTIDSASVILGCEIDSAACRHAVALGLLENEEVFPDSFFNLCEDARFDLVIGNPPYVRLRTMEPDEKREIQALSSSILGKPVGEECSLWLPFLLKSVCHLQTQGTLAFVLPYDFTYVKYARNTWDYLSRNFESIEILRSKERIFDDILQDVVLLLAFNKGGTTKSVRYECFESNADLLTDNPSIDKRLSISEIANGKRVFQNALVSDDVLDFLESAPFLIRAGNEASFHIGYVCGNKDFFHPDERKIEKYFLPSDSLHASVISSRQLGKAGFRTSEMISSEKLWLPNDELTPGELQYVSYGEKRSVNKGYKCRIRDPWWRVPSVKEPDAIISVFGSAPRVILNDNKWTFSNSLLGAYMNDSINAEDFCLSWYSPITLLSVELEIHSLGGGVLIAVPQETSNVRKIASQYASNNESVIKTALTSNDAQSAYLSGCEQLTKLAGDEMLQKVLRDYEFVKSWRLKSK